jgi:hypothetical protein
VLCPHGYRHAPAGVAYGARGIGARENNKTLRRNSMPFARFAALLLPGRRSAAFAAAILSLFAAQAAMRRAQSAWPARQIRIVVPFAPAARPTS